MNEIAGWLFAKIDWAWWQPYLSGFGTGGPFGMFAMIVILSHTKAAKRGDEMHAQALLVDRLQKRIRENDELQKRVQVLEARLERTASEGARAHAQLLEIEPVGGVQ
jgi:hypothetical protein